MSVTWAQRRFHVVRKGTVHNPSYLLDLLYHKAHLWPGVRSCGPRHRSAVIFSQVHTWHSP